MVTLKEIAKKCNCSAATVSKALNDLPDIGDARKEQIRQAAAEMGYHFNVAAKTLKTNKSRTVGLLMFLDKGSAWTNEYYGGIAQRIQHELNRKDYDLVPIDCHQKMSGEEFAFKCISHNYDGLIVMNYGFTHEHLQKLADAHIPMITIDDPWESHNGVESDNSSGIRQIVKYAYGLGHRKIALIYGNPGLATSQRLVSFRMTAKELNLQIPNEYIVESVYSDTVLCQRQVSHLLDMADPPTCILCPDDFAALGALNECRCRGISCPEDISIAGYDGIQLASALRPRLTTVYQDVDAIGHEVVRLLFNEIHSGSEAPAERVVIPCVFIPGETIGKPKN